VLKACVVQSSKNDLSEHDVYCRQRFKKHDDVQFMKSFNVFIVIVAIVVVIDIIIVFVILSSSFVVSIVSI
jgi:hypothetical protein